jgi:nucleoside 2-deoxyribosyltransferase
MNDEDHLAQSAWNIFAAIHFEEMIERGLLPKELNDLPNYQKKEIVSPSLINGVSEKPEIKEDLEIKKDLPMIKPTKFYLAHPFDARYKMREWELEFEKKTGFELLNPFYDGVDNVGVSSVDTGRQERYESVDADDLVEKDIEHIKNCDGVIAIIDGSLSYGTIQEMVYAKFLGKPVISVVTNNHENHPWIRHHSKIIINNLEEVEQAIKDL